MNRKFDTLVDPQQAFDAANAMEINARRHGHEIMTYYQTPTVGVLIPFVQSIVTGIALGIAFGVTAWMIGLNSAFKIALATWAIAQALVWLCLLVVWFNRLGLLEQLLKTDLNKDGYIGNPPSGGTSGTIKLIAASPNGHSTQIGHLPGTKEQLTELARGLVKGSSFSYDSWRQLYSRGDFYLLQSTFVRRDWAQWKNPGVHTLGVELTDPQGLDIIEKIARGEFEFEEDTTPLPRAR